MSARDDASGADGKALEAILCAILRHALQRHAGDPDLLSVQEVSAALRCSEDTVRRIPPAALAVYRVGKSNLYFREDLLRFVRTRQVTRPTLKIGAGCAADIDALLRDVLEGDAVDVREPAERRAG